MSALEFDQAQGTDYAVMLLIRRFRRLDPATYGKIMSTLPDEVRLTLGAAEMRGDTLRQLDMRDGNTRDYPLREEPDDTD